MRGPDMKSFSGSGEGSSRLIDLRLDQALISISLDFTLGGALILRVDSPGTGQPCFKSSLGLKVWSRLADGASRPGTVYLKAVYQNSTARTRGGPE